MIDQKHQYIDLLKDTHYHKKCHSANTFLYINFGETMKHIIYNLKIKKKFGIKIYTFVLQLMHYD